MTNKVTIIGAGVVGSILALRLSKIGIKVTLLDKRPLMLEFNENFDHRTIAVAAEVKTQLEKYGIWKHLANHSGEIHQIRIIDNDSKLHLHFDNKYVDLKPLGYMIDNTRLIYSINKMVAEDKNINFICEEVVDITSDESKATIVTTSKTIESALAIIADGKLSKTRDKLDFEIVDKDYNETAIVFKVKHEKPHNNTAYEKFYPNGPFAVLPMQDPYVSGIVWMEKPEAAAAIIKQDLGLIKEFFVQKMGDFLGHNEIISKPFCYPLTLKYAKTSFKGRFALAGDALHGINPIAGQGLNLSLLDCDKLIEIITNAEELGLDIGSYSTLEKYHKSIKFDDMSMIYITDIVDKIFRIKFAPFALARKIGLAGINNISILKSLIMTYAMGKRND